MRTVDVGGVAVGALDRRGWRDHLAERMVRGGAPHHHVSLNAAKWHTMARDPELRRIITEAGSVAADGIGIVWAAAAAGDPLPERVAGADLAADLVARAGEQGKRVGLLGARPHIVGRVAHTLRSRGIDVAIALDGYFPATEGRRRIRRIEAASVDLLLVALGSPRSEHLIGRHRPDVPLILGVGGAFDVWAGAVRRAPIAVQRAGLEWAWRFAAAPRVRFHRAIVASARFAVAQARGQRLPCP